MKKLPNKFEMCCKYARADKRIVELSSDGYYYMRKVPQSLDDAFDAPLKYSKGFVTEAIEEGSWIITKDMDEPELIFPFTVFHEESTQGLFEVTAGTQRGRVTCTYVEDRDDYQNIFSEEEARKFIEEGVWIVKHVGDTTAEKAPGAPQSASKDIATLTINVDTNEAVLAVKVLTAAFEDLAVSLESVIELQKQLKGI